MSKAVAILLDGSFVIEKTKFSLNLQPKQNPTPDQIYEFAQSLKNSDEEVFRIYFYHCSPYEGKETHPITQQQIDFSNTHIAKYNNNLLYYLSQMNFMAIRKGHLAFRGWNISNIATARLQQQVAQQQATPVAQQASQLLNSSDFKPNLTQKEVDIKIGLDVAWLSSKHIVNKIILVTGDTDLVPAMKFARREGVQVVVINILNGKNDYLSLPLKEHADEIRKIEFDSTNKNWVFRA